MAVATWLLESFGHDDRLDAAQLIVVEGPDGQSGDVIATDLDLAGVDTGPQLQADAPWAGFSYAWASTSRNSLRTTVTPGAGDAPSGGAVARACSSVSNKTIA